MSLNAMARPAGPGAGTLGDAAARSRTVAKVDSIGLAVRRWFQCSAGIVEEREQDVEVVGDLRSGLGPLGADRQHREAISVMST